ncbi:MAG: alpha/beta hydrolase [Treponema sp.]|jgi:acetyl esterase/lipase|nr:alpha/beta hydrolase [Treponema sp.]
MRSVTYRIVEKVAKIIGHKKTFQLPVPELRAYIETIRNGQKFAPPGYVYKKHSVIEECICGRPCYVIAPKNGEKKGGAESNGTKSGNEKAVLFLHGGGFIYEAHPVHWLAASKLVTRLGVTVWFPAYPLIPNTSGEKFPNPEFSSGGGDFKCMNEMIAKVYGRMLETYSAAGITFLGDSAGAMLSLIYCHHNKALKMPQPMPAKLVLLSPGIITEQDKTILDEMYKIEPRDVMLSMPFTVALISLLNLDLSRDNYFNAPLYGDFTGFPPLYVFSGTFEIFYPQLTRFVERIKAAGLPIEFYSGNEMMHVWPYMPASREARAALNQIFAIISRSETS